MQKTEIIDGFCAIADVLDGFGVEDLEYYLDVLEAAGLGISRN